MHSKGEEEEKEEQGLPRAPFFLPDLFFIEKKSIGGFGNRQINIQLQYLSKLVSDIS